MRKTIYLIICLMLLIFLIPLIFTNRRVTETSQITNENKISLENTIDYDYSKFSTIKLLHKDSNEVEEVKLDDYIACVVSAEMPVSYDIEALKAQAIVARTYTIYKITTSKKHEQADICDKSTCCQAWISKENRLKKWKEDVANENWNKIIKAVNETAGKIITYNDKPINAFFHANSGGKTEVPFYVWGGSGYPYLQSVSTAGEDAYSQYKSEVTITKQEFVNNIKEKYSDFEIDFSNENCITVLEYTDGNRVKKIKIGNKEFSGVEIRTLMGLKSANFNIEVQEDSIYFSVLGYGHGVGMSQTGADSMAKEGKNYEEIIKHFYTGVEISNI